MKIALEAHPGFVVYNVETALRLRGRGRPNLGVNFDPSHHFWQGVDVPTPSARSVMAIFHVHAKDVALDPTERGGERRHRRRRPTAACQSARGCSGASVRDTTSSSGSASSAALRLSGYDYVMSIEHEDALASIDEGLKSAVEVQSQV